VTAPSPAERLWQAVRDALDRGVFAKLSFGHPDGSEPGLRKLVVRPVVLKAGPRLQLVYSHEGRDVTRNLEQPEAFEVLQAAFPAPFRSVHLATTEKTLQLELRKDRPHLSEGPPAHTAPASTSHDRDKRRVLQPDPRWLDVLAPKHSADKRKQVLRFIEILDHWLGDVPRPESGEIRWVDMGSGSGALTFATWEYLRRTGFHQATVTGIELREPLASKTERLARSLGCEGLSFRAGAIADQELGAIDGITALHACDTATDDALAAGIAAGARWLLAAPCCHRELRPQLEPPAPMRSVLRHGILRTREAEIATDALRASLLEAAGFEARVFEFISTEHTDKNLMIAAVRKGEALGEAKDKVRELASFYGIRQQRLAERLGIPLE
jgi:hypothetical protein